MATRDLKPQVFPAQSLRPQTVTAAVNGASVDTRDHDAALIVIDAGTIGAGATATVRIQDSDDGTTWVNVPSADLDGGNNDVVIDPATDEQVHSRTYMGSRRFVRAVVSSITGTPALPLSVQVVLGFPHVYIGY